MAYLNKCVGLNATGDTVVTRSNTGAVQIPGDSLSGTGKMTSYMLDRAPHEPWDPWTVAQENGWKGGFYEDAKTFVPRIVTYLKGKLGL